MGATIAVYNNKGGVGKTVTCTNVAAVVARDYHKRVLLIDTDCQANATKALGVKDTDAIATLYDGFFGKSEIPELLIDAPGVPGLKILPSSLGLAAADLMLASQVSREHYLRKRLAGIKNEYDFIFMDVPPGFTMMVMNSLAAADYLIIPVQMGYFALEGVRHLHHVLDMAKDVNPKLTILGVVATMVRKTTLSQEVLNSIKKHFGDKVFEQTIRLNVTVDEATGHQVPVVLHEPESAGAKDYRALTKEIMERLSRKGVEAVG